MSHEFNPTKNTVRATVASFVQENLQGVELDTSMCDNEVEQAILEYLEDKGEPNVDVIYNLEAFNIVMGNEFDDFDGYFGEMSEFDTPIQALMAQANSIISDCANSMLLEEIAEVIEMITEVRDAAIALDNLGDLEPSIVITIGSLHGWAAHNYEDEGGLCFWTNLEGEGVHAIEGTVGTLTVSVCYTPEKI